MSNRITGLIAAAVVATALSACEGAANRNANQNLNANANLSPSPTPTLAANANTGPRRPPANREEYERDRERYDREAREEARGQGRTVGTGLNDAWLWTKARVDLAAEDDLRDSTINVDVDNAVVTLTGTVASAAQKTRAEQSVKALEGVKSVRNQLRIAADNANANTRRANATR